MFMEGSEPFPMLRRFNPAMRLLTVLLLYFYCALNIAASVPAIDADCDDVNIFEAVDEALKSHNNAKEDGNQFVLRRVTDAKIKDEDGGHILYFVEYEIHEGDCTVKSGKTWQKCQFEAHDPERGRCSAQIQVNENKLLEVVAQNCNSSKVPVESHVTAVHHQCLGCPNPMNTDSKEILQFVHSSIDQMNQQGGHPNYFDLERIENATYQVVRGWKYDIHYVVRQTTCSKSNFKYKNPDECKINQNGESGQCKVHISESTDRKISYDLLECVSETGMCLHCPIKLNPKDPELLTLLNQLMDDYNSNTNHTELYSVSHVIGATKQAFHEQTYEVAFLIKPTNCSKPDYTMLGDECAIIQAVSPRSCEIKFNITDKRVNVQSDLVCVVISNAFARASGLSPFRRVLPNRETTKLLNPKNHHASKVKPFGQNKKHKERNSKEDGKLNQKHKHDHANEEARRHPTVPKCPGKLWHPVNVDPTAKPLTDDDLASAADNSISLSEQGENGDGTKENLSFSDDDLLS